ncbi:MAG: family 10 glycosylhydrolase, partial [Myxococcales bacterium]|nr:family 10 glycosylhydrolase [Myxococcales bacterium]
MRAAVLVTVALCACGEDRVDAASRIAGAVGLQVPDRRELVHVEVPRELRGLWVATVANLDFPTRQGLPPAAMAAELDAIVDEAADLGVNTLIFQVRTEGDALYRSEHEPWSRFLSGQQGRDPGFDPLAYLIERGHARGLQVHAWFNPYRAATDRRVQVAPNHLASLRREHAKPWGHLLWLDPGEATVRDHAVDVVVDVVERYDIDGVHLDDYFYP